MTIGAVCLLHSSLLITAFAAKKHFHEKVQGEIYFSFELL